MHLGYRRLYVNHIVREAPHRAVLAVDAEIVRLTSLGCFTGLCAVLMWILTAAAFARSSPAWSAFAGILAAGATALAVVAAIGIVEALRDLRRVRALADV
jgi:hypothetical protein